MKLYDFSNETCLFVRETTVLFYRFFVLASQENITSLNYNDVMRFWNFEAICIEYQNEIFLNKLDYLTACNNSYWSTYYPDPKSYIDNDNLGVDIDMRVHESNKVYETD